MELLYLLIVFAFGACLFFGMPFARNSSFLVSLCFWVGIMVAIASGYSWLDKQGSVGSVAINSKDVKFKKAFDGHFYILARTSSGGLVRFLFDTGASDIVLSPKDARALGFDLQSLLYNKSYHTSNGVIKAAPVVIPLLKIGNVSIADISASVSSVPSPYSLMGMSFIENYAFSVNEDSLTITFD